MTKNRLNKILASALVAVFAFAAASPVLAENRATTTTQKNSESDQARKMICQNIQKFQQNLNKRLTDRQERLDSRLEDRTQKVKDFKADRQDALVKFRETRDGNFRRHYEKLLERAKTDAQKTAVNEFKTTMNAALVARRTTVDAANRAFQEGLKTAWASRKTAIENARKEFAASVDAAKKQAAADCSNGLSAGTIAEKYRAALKAAREKLVSDSKASPKIADALDQLKETRRAAIEKAFGTFKLALESAIKKLKTAFGEAKTEEK